MFISSDFRSFFAQKCLALTLKSGIGLIENVIFFQYYSKISMLALYFVFS